MLTSTRDYSAQARTASGINILLGLWLMVSPWVFDYSGTTGVVSSVLVGGAIAFLAASRLADLRASKDLSAVNLVLSLWTIASRWMTGYASNLGAAAH